MCGASEARQEGNHDANAEVDSRPTSGLGLD